MSLLQVGGERLRQGERVDFALIIARKVSPKELPLDRSTAGMSFTMKSQQHALQQNIALAIHRLNQSAVAERRKGMLVADNASRRCHGPKTTRGR